MKEYICDGGKSPVPEVSYWFLVALSFWREGIDGANSVTAEKFQECFSVCVWQMLKDSKAMLYLLLTCQ